MKINIKGINKAQILLALYGRANSTMFGVMGKGYVHLNEQDAKKLLEKSTSFRELHGRSMGIDLSGDELDTSVFNQYNGDGAAEDALAPIIPALNKEKLGSGEVLDKIFKSHITVRDGYECTEYYRNHNALVFASAHKDVDNKFLSQILAREYSDKGNEFMGMSQYGHSYTQRSIISRNSKALYAFLDFAKDKSPELFNELLFNPNEGSSYSRKIPAPEVVEAAMLDTERYIQPPNSNSEDIEEYRPLILDILDDKEKVALTIKTVLPEPKSLVNLVDFVTSHVDKDNKVAVFSFVQTALESLDGIADKKIRESAKQSVMGAASKNLSQTDKDEFNQPAYAVD